MIASSVPHVSMIYICFARLHSYEWSSHRAKRGNAKEPRRDWLKRHHVGGDWLLMEARWCISVLLFHCYYVIIIIITPSTSAPLFRLALIRGCLSSTVIHTPTVQFPEARFEDTLLYTSLVQVMVKRLRVGVSLSSCKVAPWFQSTTLLEVVAWNSSRSASWSHSPFQPTPNVWMKSETERIQVISSSEYDIYL
jgi:hypothetical protein